MTKSLNPHLFVHCADLHLAVHTASINKRDSQGRLIRELDMEQAFIAAVNETLQQEPLPSTFVIAGDLFDHYKGSPEAFIVLVQQLRRLTQAGIAVVGIAGNHDTPTNTMKTPKFQELQAALANDPLVTLAYDSIEQATIGEITYVLLPHSCCIQGSFTEDDLQVTTDAPYKVLVVHGVAAGDPSLQQMDEAKEVPIAKWIMDLPWNYVAFGHYHKPGWIPGYKGKAAYCGSLENTVISGPDVCMERGPVFVDLSQTGTAIYDMHTQPIRSIRVLPDLDYTDNDIDAETLDQEITQLILNSQVDDAIVIHKVKGLTRSLYKSLQRRTFQQVNPQVLYLRTDFSFREELPGAALHTEDANKEPDDTAENDDTIEEKGTERHFQECLPLDKEMEYTLNQLIQEGIIAASRKEAIQNVLGDFV